MMKRKVLIILTFAALAAPFAASALTLGDLQTQLGALQQRIAGLVTNSSVSGSADAQVSSSLPRICSILLSRSLSVGVRGDDVTSLQEFLTSEGTFSASATGYFGPITASALARWQSSQGISSVGVAGPITLARLRVRCGLPGPSDLSTSPSSGAAPLIVHFTYPPKEENAGQFYIEFGDGTSQVMDTHQIYCIRAPCISPSVASHTYTSAGVYTATVSRYIACLYSNPRCMMAQPAPLARAVITVRGSGTGGAPTISSFSGPTTLSVNETGTWSVLASDPENGSLTYSIKWGDEQTVYPYAASSPMASDVFVQTTSFTHTYASAGTYTVSITVRDTTGLEAQASASVRVGASVACTLQYNPVCGRAPGCANTCPAGMYCTMACQLHNPQTYGNRCQLDASGAEYLYAGACTQ